MWKYVSGLCLFLFLLSIHVKADIRASEYKDKNLEIVSKSLTFWSSCSINADTYMSEELKKYFFAISLFKATPCSKTMSSIKFDIKRISPLRYRVTSYLEGRKYFEFVARVKNSKVYPYKTKSRVKKFKIYR